MLQPLNSIATEPVEYTQDAAISFGLVNSIALGHKSVRRFALYCPFVTFHLFACFMLLLKRCLSNRVILHELPAEGIMTRAPKAMLLSC